MQCPAGMRFVNCVSNCPPSCFNHNPKCIENEETCTEGCQCPKGTLLQNNKCIKPNQCGCKMGPSFVKVNKYSLNVTLFTIYLNQIISNQKF